MEWPTQADGWWPRPGETFTHKGVVRDIRAFLRSVGMSPPFRPEFPHTWRDECSNDGLFNCGPGNTERERLADPTFQEEFGSRPLFRRFEVMISMPGEAEDDPSARGIPDEWVSSFSGYASEPLGDTPTEAREKRTESFSSSGEPDFGSREWLQDFLTDDDGELRFVGTRLADVLDGALAWSADAEVNPVDCLRFLPSDEPVADREAAVVADEFWNTPEWRECAGQAFSSGGTARLSAGTTGLNTWLRHRGGDPDRERNMEVAETNLDMGGWAVGSEGVERDYQLGMPEVPAGNQAILNGLLGLSGADVAWYRTGGIEISCLWGGFYQTNLVASAQAMEDSARQELEDRLGELVDVQEALGGELAEARRPDVRTWSGGTRNHRTTPLGCSGDGFRDFLNEWEQQHFQETCQCNTTIIGDVNIVDCPTSRAPDQSGQPMNAPMCTTSSWWTPQSSITTEADPSCACGGSTSATTCNSDGTSTTASTSGFWDGAQCQTSSSSQNNGRDSSCSCSWIGEGCDAQTGFRFYRDSCGQQANERREDSSCPQPDPENCDWVDDACDGTSGFRFQVRDADSCPSPHQRRVADDVCVDGCEPDWNVACDTANGVNTGTFTWTDAKNCPDESPPTGQDPTCGVCTWSAACNTDSNGDNIGTWTWAGTGSCAGESEPTDQQSCPPPPPCEPSWSVACDTANGVNTGAFTWTDAENCPDESPPTGQDPTCGVCTWSAACNTDSNGDNIGTWTWTGTGSCAGESEPTGQQSCPPPPPCEPSWSVACDTANGVNTGAFTWTDAKNCPDESPPTGQDPTCGVCTWSAACNTDSNGDNIGTWTWTGIGSCAGESKPTGQQSCPPPPPCEPSWSVACDKNTAGQNTGMWTWSDAYSCPGAVQPTGPNPICGVPCTPTWSAGACELDGGGNMTGSRWQTAVGCSPNPAAQLVSDSSCVPSTPTPMCQCYNCIQVGCDNCLENPDEAILFEWVSVGAAPEGSCLSQAELCPGGGGFPSGTQCGGGSGFAPSGADPSTIGRFSQLGGIGARPVGPGYSSLSPVLRATAPGRVSLQDSVLGASRAFMNDASRGGVRDFASRAPDASLSADLPLPGGVSDWVRSRTERARQQARQFAAEPTDRRSFQSGVRAMRDGVALAEVIAANRLAASMGDFTGGPPPSAPVGAGGFASGAFAPLSRSTDRASVRSAASAAGVPLAAAAPAASGGVWAAADRGTDVAAGGWYGWNVDGTPCASGTDCADAMVRAFTTQSSWTIPPTFMCAPNQGFVGPFCLNALFEKRQELIGEIILWAGTMQGWIAIKEYRQEVYNQIASNSSPYLDWSTFGGSMPNVAESSYVTAETGMTVSNPMCVVPPATNPVPLHSMGEQDTVAYRNANDTNSPAIWDDSGTRRLTGGGLGQNVWPPTDALQDVVLRGGSTRTMAPGRYEAGETLLELREMFYGDQWPAEDPPYDPEAFDRFGAPSVQDFDPSDYPNMPRTLMAMDHLTNPSFLETSVIFREFACPAEDVAGNFGSIRPVVCQDGTVRSAMLLLDHQTPCSASSDDCELRVFSEPVLGTGGAGYDAQRLSYDSSYDSSSDESYADLFGPHYRHVCEFDSSGMITNVLDGRVAADEAVTISSFQPYVYHWRAGAPGDSGEWVPGAGVGDGFVHGHNPDEGYYPRAGWYIDQNGDEVWFEPFSSYDNYGDVQTAGDFSDGEQELIMRGDAANPGELFVEHVDESRILYDEFIATPYEVQDRNADFQLWDGVRSGAVNTDDAHLVWGWPTLDLQDNQTSAARRAQVMRVRRLTTQQKLFGLPPGASEAEQIWVRNDGPMSFFGATRVGNGVGGGEKGGCLLEVNPPEPRSISQGEALPFRQVLDPTLQAWCVMARDIGPEDSCISMPNAPLPGLRRQR